MFIRASIASALLTLTSVQNAPKPAPPEAEGVDSIRWSASRPLRWANYLAKPQIVSGASAMTAYVISYADGCTADLYAHDIVAAFLPERSWVKSDLLFRGGDLALQHEQTHFDIGELHARKIRKALDGLVKPCEMTDQARGKVVITFLQEDRDRQARYDAQTRYGTDARRQLDWVRQVQRELEVLKAFPANVPRDAR